MTPARAVPRQRGDTWSGLDVAVLGLGAAGFAAADNLAHLGAAVTLCAPEAPDAGPDAERLELLQILGVEVRLGPLASLPAVEVVVVADPARMWAPELAAAAAERGVAVWGEIDLAWRLRDPAEAAPWLVVGGQGAEDVTAMVAQMLRAAGRQGAVCGAGGLPLVEAVMDPAPYHALIVAVDAEQIRFAGEMAAYSAALLDGSEAALGRVYGGVRNSCVYRVSDARTEALVREADVVEGARAIGVTLGTPAVGMVGVVEQVLADRAFVADRQTSAAELGAVADVADAGDVPAALTAAALARSLGVEPVAVREGLRRHRHRAG